MKIYKLFDNNWNKVNNKQELLSLLKKYEGILSTPMIDYLNSLIELEFSIIRDYISEEDRKALAELEIYKRIAIFNIYNRALNLFNNESEEFSIFDNNNGIERLTIYANSENSKIALFDFDYGKNHLGFNSKIPNGYKTMEIGTISLFQTFESEKLREAELNRVMSKLERLYDEQNPYRFSTRPGVVGGPSSTWALQHSKKIAQYEKRFQELDSKKELTDDEKKEIEITRQYHDLLLEDYDLTQKSFEDESNKPFANFMSEKTNLRKTLVKKMPNLTIKDDIKYI